MILDEFIHKRSDMNDITSIRLSIKQSPDPSEGNRAVVKVTLQNDTGIFQGIGVATPDNIAGKTDSQELIDFAVARGMQRAKENAVNIENLHVQPTNITAATTSNSTSSPERRHRTEPGSMTPRQKEVLEDIAGQTGKTLDSLAQHHMNKDSRSLSSADANFLINKYRR